MPHPQPPRMHRFKSGCKWVLAGWIAFVAGGTPHTGWTTPPAACSFDAAPLPLVPQVPRNEIDHDRIEAQTLFATARLLEDRGQLLRQGRSTELTAWYETAALRKYERAFRRDPRATRILRPIIALAQAQGRIDEAARYAAIAVQRDPTDTRLARWLALYHADQGQWDTARQLDETIIATRAGQTRTAASPTGNLSLWLEFGRLAYLTRHYAQASAAFTTVETALQSPLSGDSDQRIRTILLDHRPLAFQLFGAAHLAAGNLAAAEAAFRQGCQDPADSDTLAFHLAQLAQRRHDPKLAEQELQKYFDRGSDKQGRRPYQLLADLLADQNRQGDLIDRLEQLRRRTPENLPLATFLARQYLSQNRLAAAETLFQKIIDTIIKRRQPLPPQDAAAVPDAIEFAAVTAAGNPNDDAHLANALAGLTEVYRRQNDAPALLQVVTRTVQRTGSLECLEGPLTNIAKTPPLLNTIFHAAETAQSQQRPPAAVAANDAARVDLAMAELALMTEQLDAGSQFYLRAVDELPKHAAMLCYRWGLAQLDHEDYATAAKVFQEGISRQLSPPDPRVRKAYQANLYFFLAGALEMTGATSRALAAARQAAELQPDSALIASRQPWIYRHAKRPTAAQRGYQRLIDAFDLKGHDRSTRKVLQAARFELSQLAIDRNDPLAAEQWLEQVLDEDPQNVGALNDLGFLWADQRKHLRRALTMVRQAVDAHPDNKAYRDSLGWVYFQLGRYPEAIDHLEKAADDEPPDGEVLDHLGDCYSRLGRQHDATAAWQRSVRRLDAQGRPLQAARVQKKLGRDHRQRDSTQEMTDWPYAPKTRQNRSNPPANNRP